MDDNLEVYGDNTYRYDEDGYLTEKTTPQGITTYEYGTLGELRKVVTPTKTIEYLHNANNQRVAKKVDGEIVKDDLRKLNLPIKMRVRFVQVLLDNGTVEVLATNILDNRLLQTSNFKELYARRWGIETYYDVLKNRLSLENFTGLTALAIKQDFYETIFLANYEAMLVCDTNLEF